MSLILTRHELKKLEEIVSEELLDSGAELVVVADLSGNLILRCGTLEMDDIFSLAALSAANFAATAHIAKLIGEDDFTLMFHKGGKRNIHFSRLGTEYLIITLFSDSVSLGLIRLKLVSALQQMSAVFGDKAEGNA